MAEVQSIKEEFLTCSICTEIYTDPCTLGCQHSFCRKCVTGFIKTQPDSIQGKTIPCAMCRQDTPVPNPTRPVVEWAKQLKPSLMLQGLMDKLHSGHKHVEGNGSCFLCKEVGETTSASHWCFDCEISLCGRCAKMHVKSPYTRDHDVSDQVVGVTTKERSKDSCREHEGEEINFICKDCNKIVCQTCRISKHKACTHVVTIESLIPEIKAVLTEERRILKERIEAYAAVVKREESTIQQFKANENKVEEEIKSAIESVIALLRKREEEFMKDLRDASDKQVIEHQASLKSGQITLQLYQQHSEFIDQTLQSESKRDMYDMYQVCLSRTVQSMGDTVADTRSTSVEGQVKFTPNIEPLGKAVIEMGSVNADFLPKEATASPKQRKPESIFQSKPVLHDTINIQHSSDKNRPTIADFTVLDMNGVNTVVVADSSNSSLKSIYERNGQKSVSNLKLPGEPYRLTKVSGNRVACTSSNSFIVEAEVSTEVTLITSLKTSKQYCGLGSLSDLTFVAGVLWSNDSGVCPAVDILEHNGDVLRSFNAANIGLDLIKNPQYICITHKNNRILVSDSTSRSVYCLTSKGEVEFTFKPTGDRALKNPRSISVTKTGDILVTDGTYAAIRILQLSSSGKYVKEILDDLGSPSVLRVDDNNVLYVSPSYGDKHIKIFEFS